MPERLLWTFSPVGQQVHFRVEWTVNFVGSPYEVRQCHFDIQGRAGFSPAQQSLAVSMRLKVGRGSRGDAEWGLGTPAS